jgi:hypothetical protein
MFRNLMLVAVLVGSLVFTSSEAQACFKKGFFHKKANCSTCNQSPKYSGCGSNATVGSYSTPAPTSNYNYVSQNTSSFDYSTPTSSVVSSPSTISQTAIIDGKIVVLNQIGTSAGQPVYTISPAVNGSSAPMLMPNK